MSATGFHPEPSAKAPWTRTTVLTAAYAGDEAAKAAPVRRARIKRWVIGYFLSLAFVSKITWIRRPRAYCLCVLRLSLLAQCPIRVRPKKPDVRISSPLHPPRADMTQTYCILVPSAGRRQAHVPAHASDAPAHPPRTSDEIESPGQGADRGLDSRPPFVPGTGSLLTALPMRCRQSFTCLHV